MVSLTNFAAFEMLSAVSSLYCATASSLTEATHVANGIGSTLIMLIVAAYSLVQCYFGYIIFRVMLVIQGVISGLGVGALIGSGIALASGSFDGGGIAIIVIAAVICGIVGGIMAHFLYKFGVFMYYFLIFGLIGAGIGLLAGGGDYKPALAAGLITGVIAGIIGVVFDRYIIIGTTAVCFGILAGAAIGTITVLWLGIVLSIVFVVTGIIVQIRMTKKRSKKNAQPAVPGATNSPQPVQYQQSAPAALLCAYCGASLDPGAAFCVRCGRPIAIAQPVPANTYAQPVAQEALAYSPEPVYEPTPVPTAAPVYYAEPVSAPIPDEPTVLYQTAGQTADVPAFCPSCGAKLEIPGALFCDSCGSKIEI